jgi:hypothetical protein
VKLHPNARTTPYARQLLVDRVRRLGWSMQDAAQAAGLSVRTGYRWLARERREGSAGFGIDRAERGGSAIVRVVCGPIASSGSVAGG